MTPFGQQVTIGCNAIVFAMTPIIPRLYTAVFDQRAVLRHLLIVVPSFDRRSIADLIRDG